jgi:transcriptional regulator with XRE-family HTH domain
MTVNDDFSRRLRAAMQAAGLKPSGTVLEQAFNRHWRDAPISKQTASNWINGKYFPKHDKLRVIARVLKTDPHALMYGPRESMRAEERRGPWEERSTPAERQAIDTFLNLPAPQRLIVRDVINGFAAANGAARPDEA